QVFEVELARDRGEAGFTLLLLGPGRRLIDNGFGFGLARGLWFGLGLRLRFGCGNLRANDAHFGHGAYRFGRLGERLHGQLRDPRFKPLHTFVELVQRHAQGSENQPLHLRPSPSSAMLAAGRRDARMRTCGVNKFPFPTRRDSVLTSRMIQPFRSPRLPTFTAVPVKRRADGWTPLRQCELIGVLAETGWVAEAARFVGMARETAYRLRGKPGAEEFARAWDMALQIAGVRRPGEPGVLPPVRYGNTFGAATGPPPGLSRRIGDGGWRRGLRRGR